MVIPEKTTMALTEGMAKGGYPVDIAAQSTVDLTSICQSELGCTGTSLENESGLEPAGVAQLEMGYTVLGTQESYNKDQEISPCITEVIQPMEMAELVDILPTLSLIEEVTPSDPPTPSVMDMLESFGLGINQNNALFQLENSGLTSVPECVSPPEADCTSTCIAELQGQDLSACHAAVNTVDGESPGLYSEFSSDNTEVQHVNYKRFPVRNQVEWARPSKSTSW